MQPRYVVDEEVRRQARDFLSKDTVEELHSVGNKEALRSRHGLMGPGFDATSREHEEKVNAYIEKHLTWRSNVPLLRSAEYWRLRADFYPYISNSDAHDDFFIRGVACHPRLSEYPMCKNVIRDYFVCRDVNKVLQMFNVCAPLKEQITACINDVFIKNHERGDKKFNSQRDQYFEEQRQKRLAKMMSQVEDSLSQKNKLQD